jgi:hypothetical protein
MLKKIVLYIAMAVVLNVVPPQGRAQEAASNAKAKAGGNAYRLDFVVNETEDGRKINARQYGMNLTAGDGNEVKIGTRVPVEAKQGEFQYIDVGTKIWCRLDERDNDLVLNVRSDISNFAVADQQNTHVMPLLRQMTINASTVAIAGKTVVVGSVEDPSSKRQFSLEVTANRIR